MKNDSSHNQVQVEEKQEIFGEVLLFQSGIEENGIYGEIGRAHV